MKFVIIFIISLTSFNCLASDIRMATSEDIDLFDKALESSEQIIKKNSELKKGEFKKSEKSDSVVLNDDKDHFKNRDKIDRKRGTEQLEEHARNKRKNRKRKRNP